MSYLIHRYLLDSGESNASTLLPEARWVTVLPSEEETALRDLLDVQTNLAQLSQLVLSFRHLQALVDDGSAYFPELWTSVWNLDAESSVKKATNSALVLRLLVGTNTMDLFSEATSSEEKLAVLATALILQTKEKYE